MSEPKDDDEFSVTLRDVDGRVVVQFYWIPGRDKVYMMGPSLPAESIDREVALKLASLITDALGAPQELMPHLGIDPDTHPRAKR